MNKFPTSVCGEIDWDDIGFQSYEQFCEVISLKTLTTLDIQGHFREIDFKAPSSLAVEFSF